MRTSDQSPFNFASESNSNHTLKFRESKTIEFGGIPKLCQSNCCCTLSLLFISSKKRYKNAVLFQYKAVLRDSVFPISGSWLSGQCSFLTCLSTCWNAVTGKAEGMIHIHSAGRKKIYYEHLLQYQFNTVTCIVLCYDRFHSMSCPFFSSKKCQVF